MICVTVCFLYQKEFSYVLVRALVVAVLGGARAGVPQLLINDSTTATVLD